MKAFFVFAVLFSHLGLCSVGSILTVKEYGRDPKNNTNRCQKNGRWFLGENDSCELFYEDAVKYCAQKGGIPDTTEFMKFSETRGTLVRWNPKSLESALPWDDAFTESEKLSMKRAGFDRYMVKEQNGKYFIDYYYNNHNYQRPALAKPADFVWTSSVYPEQANALYAFMEFTGGFISVYHGIPGQSDSLKVRCRR